MTSSRINATACSRSPFAPDLRRTPRAAIIILGVLGVGAVARADGPAWFSDRPPAWSEHDDGDLPRAPAPTHLEDLDTTLLLRDSLAGEVDRVLSRDGGRPAADVNALDEVPCSTWFCAR